MEPIRLHFAFTPTDVHRAYRLYQRRTHRDLREKIFASLVFLVALGNFFIDYYPTLLYGIPRSLDTYFVPIVFLLLAIAIWFDLATVLGWWRGERKRRNEPPVFYDLSFDENGASFVNATTNVKLAWTEFTKVYEDQYSFLLMLKNSKKEYWTIPKQYFALPRDMDEFQRLLEAHISAP